jgi:polar amino acid transport system substrate-binding protein
MISRYKAQAFIAIYTLCAWLLIAFAPSAYADHPNAVTHDKILRVAFGVERPPFVFKDREKGLELELIRAITHHMGYQIKPLFVPNTRGPRTLRNHKIDMLTLASKEMALEFFLSSPYISFDNVVIARSDNPAVINDFADLKDTRLAAFHNAHVYIKALGKIKSELRLYIETPNQNTQVLLLYKNRVDYLFCDKKVFEYYREHAIKDQIIPKDGLAYKIHIILAPTHYSAAFNDAALRDQFNLALKEVMRSGEFETIMAKYDSDFSELPTTMPPKATKPLD